MKAESLPERLCFLLAIDTSIRRDGTLYTYRDTSDPSTAENEPPNIPILTAKRSEPHNLWRKEAIEQEWFT